MLENLRSKSESYRHKAALGSAFAITLMIAGVWAQQRGFFGFGSEMVATQPTEPETQQLLASVYSSQNRSNSNQISQASDSKNTNKNTENSPLSNTKNAFSAAFSELGAQYDALKESLSSVLVPFITGIEVYEKGEVK